MIMWPTQATPGSAQRNLRQRIRDTNTLLCYDDGQVMELAKVSHIRWMDKANVTYTWWSFIQPKKNVTVLFFLEKWMTLEINKWNKPNSERQWYHLKIMTITWYVQHLHINLYYIRDGIYHRCYIYIYISHGVIYMCTYTWHKSKNGTVEGRKDSWGDKEEA